MPPSGPNPYNGPSANNNPIRQIQLQRTQNVWNSSHLHGADRDALVRYIDELRRSQLPSDPAKVHTILTNIFRHGPQSGIADLLATEQMEVFRNQVSNFRVLEMDRTTAIAAARAAEAKYHSIKTGGGTWPAIQQRHLDAIRQARQTVSGYETRMMNMDRDYFNSAFQRNGVVRITYPNIPSGGPATPMPGTPQQGPSPGGASGPGGGGPAPSGGPPSASQGQSSGPYGNNQGSGQQQGNTGRGIGPGGPAPGTVAPGGLGPVIGNSSPSNRIGNINPQPPNPDQPRITPSDVKALNVMDETNVQEAVREIWTTNTLKDYEKEAIRAFVRTVPGSYMVQPSPEAIRAVEHYISLTSDRHRREYAGKYVTYPHAWSWEKSIVDQLRSDAAKLPNVIVNLRRMVYDLNEEYRRIQSIKDPLNKSEDLKNFEMQRKMVMGEVADAKAFSQNYLGGVDSDRISTIVKMGGSQRINFQPDDDMKLVPRNAGGPSGKPVDSAMRSVIQHAGGDAVHTPLPDLDGPMRPGEFESRMSTAIKTIEPLIRNNKGNDAAWAAEFARRLDEVVREHVRTSTPIPMQSRAQTMNLYLSQGTIKTLNGLNYLNMGRGVNDIVQGMTHNNMEVRNGGMLTVAYTSTAAYWMSPQGQMAMREIWNVAPKVGGALLRNLAVAGVFVGSYGDIASAIRRNRHDVAAAELGVATVQAGCVAPFTAAGFITAETGIGPIIAAILAVDACRGAGVAVVRAVDPEVGNQLNPGLVGGAVRALTEPESKTGDKRSDNSNARPRVMQAGLFGGGGPETASEMVVDWPGWNAGLGKDARNGVLQARAERDRAIEFVRRNPSNMAMETLKQAELIFQTKASDFVVKAHMMVTGHMSIAQQFRGLQPSMIDTQGGGIRQIEFVENGVSMTVSGPGGKRFTTGGTIAVYKDADGHVLYRDVLSFGQMPIEQVQRALQNGQLQIRGAKVEFPPVLTSERAHDDATISAALSVPTHGAPLATPVIKGTRIVQV